jgi:hypothetical protein
MPQESPTKGSPHLACGGTESLLNFIAADYPIFESNTKKSKKQQDLSQEKHRILSEAEGRSLAHFLLEQWNSNRP